MWYGRFVLFQKHPSLQYLSLNGLYKAVNGNNGYCDACFTKNYPVPLIDQTLKKQQKEQIKLV